MKYVQVVKEWNSGNDQKLKDYDLDINITINGLKVILTDELLWLRKTETNSSSDRSEKHQDIKMRIVSYKGFTQAEIDNINYVLDNL